MKKRITIELMEDLVLSQQSATTGEHATLSHIPGSVLLGSIAAHLYPRDDLDTFALFHSGEVRFGNAYPLSLEGEASVPMPFSFHYAKDSKSEHKGEFTQRKWLNNQACVNLARVERDFGALAEAQAKQLRTGFLTSGFEKLDVDLGLQLKTAINSETGRAATAQLFGYQSIRAGQIFGAEISVAPSQEAVWPMIENILLSGPVLGRSRSAEFGRVRIRIEDSATESAMSKAADSVLLALSDWLLINSNGQPETRLTPALLGLASGCIDWTRSFVRTRSYSPYNAKRRAYDAERQVIQQGSVVVINGLADVDQARLMELGRQGIGLFREQGLGMVGVNLPLLQASMPGIAPSEFNSRDVKPVVAQSVSAPDTPLVKWLKARSKGLVQADSPAKKSEDLSTRLLTIYQAMRVYANVPPKTPCGPGKTQWGRISELGKAIEVGQHGRKLFDELRDVRGEGILKSKDAFWGQHFYNAEVKDSSLALMSIGDWLLGELKSLHTGSKDKDGHTVEPLTERQLGTVCQLLARRAQEASIQTIREGN
jgi:CRISPR-associated protein Csx10